MTKMGRGTALLALTAALAGTSCTGTSHLRSATPHRNSPAVSAASAGPVYRVVSTVETGPDEVSVLCGPGETTASGGPTGRGQPLACGRIRVLGMPAAGVPGSRIVDGYTTTTPLLLAGRWHDGALTLTRVPKPTTRFWQVSVPCADDPGPAIPAHSDPNIARRIADDRDALRALGTDVYSISACGRWIFVTVPVADDATETLFNTRYGPTVMLYGWLRATA